MQAKVTQFRDRGTTDGEELAELRRELKRVGKKIRATIDREAGVKMIIEWYNEMKKRSDKAWIPQAAILFLTARQDASLPAEIKKIRECFGGSSRMKWITKPALELQVVAAAAELLT